MAGVDSLMETEASSLAFAGAGVEHGENSYSEQADMHYSKNVKYFKT